ncbi:hypothetical protein MGMO_146c00270 [Methyloglobulus morosus KoM1]|uniref:Uncharacterized protein n=1 Tax=Methyloglobulus morosus KoM1 TaxID=1116472 RepID=V5BVB2_9GAMM|nr:hypothetical protein [Methyloglobulus morosus]ESS68488.1 hypothetical protein MGMO_146c00270 [Methyloglobulus morosus KoM1]
MENVIKILDGTLLCSIRDDLRKYLNLNKNTKFVISSDYYLEDKHMPNKVASFSIIPYDFQFEPYLGYLGKMAPNDIKNCRTVSTDFIRHISEKRIFSVSFIFKSLKGLTEQAGLSSREFIMQQFDYTISMVKCWMVNQPEGSEYFESIVIKLNAAKKNLNKKSPNLNLYRNVLIVSLLASYLAYLLTKESKAEVIGWFSDQDKIVDAWDRIAQDLFTMNHNALCERDGLNSKDTKLLIGVKEKGEQQLWYDEINRIPDHLASALASWDLNNNTVKRVKHTDVLRQCFADNHFCSIIAIDLSPTLFKCCRLTVSKNPIKA